MTSLTPASAPSSAPWRDAIRKNHKKRLAEFEDTEPEPPGFYAFLTLLGVALVACLVFAVRAAMA